jgi:hypothetical protein
MNLRQNPLHHTINGITYTSTKLPASEGLAILAKLAPVLPDQIIRLVVNSLLPSQDGEDRPRRIQDLSPEQVQSMIVFLLEQMARIDMVGLAKRILANVTFERVKIPVELRDEETFDDHFAGEYEQLFAVLKFAFLHNFAGPTRGSLSKSGSLGTPMAGQTKNSDT